MNISDFMTRIRDDGWTIVDSIIPEDKVGKIRESIVATVEDAKASPNSMDLRTAQGSLINVNQSFAPYLSNPHIVGVAEALWGQHVKITITTPVILFPGEAPRDSTPTGPSIRNTRP